MFVCLLVVVFSAVRFFRPDICYIDTTRALDSLQKYTCMPKYVSSRAQSEVPIPCGTSRSFSYVFVVYGIA